MAVWRSAITWRSKALRPPSWPLANPFRCRLPHCLRRTLRTNTTTINYTNFSDYPIYGSNEEFWSQSALAQSTCESVTRRAPSISKPDTPQSYANFTTFVVRSPGIEDIETFDDSLVAFSNLETGLSQSDLDFWSLEFPITYTLGPVLEPSASLPLFPQDPAIEQTVEELLQIAGEAPSQRDGPSLISTVSSVAPPASPTSSPSPSIRCSWPTCEKVFKNRSDYKYVAPPDTVRSDLIYSFDSATTADTTTYRSSVCPVLFVKPQRESLIGTSIQFTSSLRSTFARFLHAADP